MTNTTLFHTPPKSPSRDLSLDFLKGFAMVMVVFFHNVQLNPASIADNLCMLACNAAVPCFFLVSGCLFFSRPFTLEKHIRRMIRFYLVMVVWRVIYLALYHIWGTPVPGSLRTLASYLFLFQNIGGVETSHFWFMDAYLTILLAAPLLHTCMKHNRKLIWYTLAVLVLFNQLLTEGNLLLACLSRFLGKPALDVSAFAEVNPFSFRHSNYMVYYLGGYLLREAFAQIPPQGSNADAPAGSLSRLRRAFTGRTAPCLMIALGIAGLTLIKYLQSGTLQWQNLHISSGYYWCSTLILACGMFLLSAQFPYDRCSFLRVFARTAGTSTMGIFYLHIPLIFLLRPVFTTYLSPYNGWLVNLAESLVITAIACAITKIGRSIPIIKHLFQG